MELDRRSFLRGAISAIGVAALPLKGPALAAVPAIVGDGLHDDAPGFQAAIAGKPFRCEGKAWVKSNGGMLCVGAGVYRLSHTVEITEAIEIKGGTFKGEQVPVFRATAFARVVMRNMTIICPDTADGERSEGFWCEVSGGG